MVYMTTGQIQHYARHREGGGKHTDLKSSDFNFTKEDFEKYVMIPFDTPDKIKYGNLEKLEDD